MSKEPMEAAHLRVLEASLSGDLEPMVSLFAEDAVVMPMNDTTLYGKSEVKAWWEEYFQYFNITSSVETERAVTYAGDLAFDRNAFSISIVPKQRGPKIKDDVRSLVVWKRGPDGSWKISHQMWNSVKPVGAGTNRYMTKMLQKKTR
jgi:ketosteroid isomerase-like protein